MITLLLNTTNGIRTIPEEGTVQVLGDGSFHYLDRYCGILFGYRREVTREEGVFAEMVMRSWK